MRTKIIQFGVIWVCIFCVFSEISAKKKRLYNCTKKVEKAKIQFEKGRFYKVKTMLNEVKLNCSGHTTMDTILFMLSKANLETKQPMEARIELEVLIQDFPQSSYAEEAHFLLGFCSYKESESYERDQIKTKEAISDFNDFILDYPNSQYKDSAAFYLKECKEKLVKKEVMSARFYERIDQFDAAVVYYKIIINKYPESDFIPDCLLSLYRNLIKTSRPKEAVMVLESILSSDADEETKRKAQNLLNKHNKNQENKNLDSLPKNTGNSNSSL